MRVLGVVTARGGSKGVPGKNIRPLGGKPLLAWTIDAAKRSRLARTILSTDDEPIAAVAKAFGLEVPFMRPDELARDTSPTLPALQHAVRWLEDHEHDRYDAICLLQPTNPLRTAAVIDACIELLESSNADSVVTVLPVPAEYNPHWVYFADGSGALKLATGEAVPIPRRQDLPRALHREGSVYIMRRDVLLEHDSLYGARVLGYEVDPATCVNIDTLEDWARAEQLIAEMAR